jgi:hypothetical protein
MKDLVQIRWVWLDGTGGEEFRPQVPERRCLTMLRTVLKNQFKSEAEAMAGD